MYSGSAACASCHRSISEAHGDSLHQKMMRSASAPGVTVARFFPNDPHVSPEEVVWAIGGKWEQQFMGEDEEGETLIPGSWHVGREEWDFRGWDGWERPIPRERCHGCHTVGLDVETGEFEEANIGCESCHGPASRHVETWGFGPVYSGVESEVCGQCHARGTDPSGRFFFPVDYAPGGSLALEESFNFVMPSPGQDSSHWWGNGHARKRHQEYSASSIGGHVNALRSLRDDYDGRYGEVRNDCLNCHSADFILAGYRKPSLSEVNNGITCAVCHNVHGELDAIRQDCTSCHGEGAVYHAEETIADHVPCPQTAQVGCVDCHMPKTGIIGGEYQLHSHSPGIIRPADMRGARVPTSCSDSGCHVDKTTSQLEAMYTGFYGDESQALEIPN